MGPGDVIFVKKRKHSSWLDKFMEKAVCAITRSRFFHVAYYVSGDTVFEANSFRNAGYANLSDYEEYEVKRLIFNYAERERILRRIISTQGAGYGWGEVFALLLRKQFGIRLFYDNPKEFICSGELVAAVYAETGIRIIDQATDDVDPETLYECPWLVGVGT